MSSQKNARCPIFYSGKDLSINCLPTNTDIIRSILFIKTGNHSLQQTITSTAEKVKEIWEQWCLPLVNQKTIRNKVKSLFEKYTTTLKSVKSKYFSTIRDSFRKESDCALFDICSCKCDDIGQCHCPYKLKVPTKMIAFLIDQRTVRKMNGRNLRNGNRKFRQTEQKENSNLQLNTDQRKRSRSEEEEPMPLTPITMKRIKLNNVALVADRFKVPNRVVATILNAGLKDMGIASPEAVIDRHKVNRAKVRVRKEVSETHMHELKKFIATQKCCALFFDGKRDFTNKIFQNEETKKFHPRVISETHYTIVVEPNENFYTHVTPPGPKANDVVDCLVQVLDRDKIKMDNFQFIGCDGTNFNVGNNSGTYAMKGVCRLSE